MEYKKDETKERTMKDIEENFIVQIDNMKKRGINIPLNEIISLFCYNEKDVMLINFYCIKWLKNIEKQMIINIIRNTILGIIENGYQKLTIHVCLKSLSVSQIDTYYSLFKDASIIFKKEFPERLEKCYLYHCSSIFRYVYKLISTMLERETLERVEVYKK
jgi:hypothetical protein